MKTVLLGVTGGGGARLLEAGETYAIQSPTLVVRIGGRVVLSGSGKIENLISEQTNYQADVYHPPRTLTHSHGRVYVAPLD